MEVIMPVKLSMNTMVGAIVLAFALTSPIVAQSACIDDPCPAPASRTQSAGAAGTLEWDVKSNYRYKVGIKFYSQTRNHVWPSNERFWVLDDYATHTYRLSCLRGEKICFGAWSTGNDKTYWGAGHGGKNACSSCCYTCGDNTRRQVLNP
jgi:hypothetical protein